MTGLPVDQRDTGLAAENLTIPETIEMPIVDNSGKTLN